jgi:hypothetical protein
MNINMNINKVIFLIIIIIVIIYLLYNNVACNKVATNNNFIINNNKNNIDNKNNINNTDNKEYLFITKWINNNPKILKSYTYNYLLNLNKPVFSKYSNLPNKINDYPDYSNYNPIVLVLNKGDSLFIPSGWWHYVISYDRNFATNKWFIPYHKNTGDDEWRNKMPEKLISNIESIDKSNMTTDKFMYYVKNSIPIVINNSHNDWSAMTNWKDDNYLIKKIDNTVLNFYKFPLKKNWNDKSENLINNILTLNKNVIQSGTYKEFRDLILNDKEHKYYLARNYDLGIILKDDYKDFDFTSQLEFAYSNVWINYSKKEDPLYSPLHYDLFDNILSQVDGYKVIYLFPPSSDKFLHPIKNTKF